MLNAKGLSSLLSQNRDDHFCKRWYLMTPNGTLLAYSQPNNINDLRKQSAIAALTWQEFSRQASGISVEEPGNEVHSNTFQDDLHILAIESEHSNVIIQKLQRQLLLVLEGGVPPRRSTFERKITAEREDGSSVSPQQPNGGSHADLATSVSSRAESSTSSVTTSVLQMQRKKLEALASVILTKFDQIGFTMPEEGSTTLF